VHAFYYLWYGTPEVDGAYKHWDHEVLPHWSEAVRQKFPHGVRFKPPEELHSPFRPSRGPYSSSSPALLRAHFTELAAEAGVGVVALSWWGPAWREGSADTQGVQTDAVLPLALDAAAAAGIKVAFHLEPYPGRTADSVREDLVDLLGRLGEHPALLRDGAGRPVFYVYDSYHIPPAEWARLLLPGGPQSLRGGPADGLFLGLWLNRNDGDANLLPGGFDGFYTYFASEAVSYGANPKHWPQLRRWAQKHGKLFVASVGPGYDDSKIRPWNAGAARDREGGARYGAWWGAALDSDAHAVSITSFNEWGEGTQIEPSDDYRDRAGQQDSRLYLRLTKEWGARLAGAGGNSTAGGIGSSDLGHTEL